MKIGLISDIHGNYSALDAVLTDLVRDRVDRIICLGDSLSSGPQPREVLARLLADRVELVLGNTDRRLLHPISPDGQSEHVRMLIEIEAWIRQMIPSGELAELGNAQQTISVKLTDRLHLLCCHGSPQSVEDRLLAELDDRQLDQLLAGQEFDLLAAGHTHVPMLRSYGARLLLNPGSVGSAVGKGPVAHYGLVTAIDGKVEYCLRTASYDVGPAILQARRTGMPHAEWWADRWATA